MNLRIEGEFSCNYSQTGECGWDEMQEWMANEIKFRQGQGMRVAGSKDSVYPQTCKRRYSSESEEECVAQEIPLRTEISFDELPRNET